jgi:hypothetical protein
MEVRCQRLAPAALLPRKWTRGENNVFQELRSVVGSLPTFTETEERTESTLCYSFEGETEVSA